MEKFVKTMFVYGTLMSGERNHHYFKDSIISIEKATVKGTIYNDIKHRCPIIDLGNGDAEGELITYNDPTGEVEKSIIELEEDFDGLFYEQVTTSACTVDRCVDIKLFCLPELPINGITKVAKRWSEK